MQRSENAGELGASVRSGGTRGIVGRGHVFEDVGTDGIGPVVWLMLRDEGERTSNGARGSVLGIGRCARSRSTRRIVTNGDSTCDLGEGT